ncbi:MAG: MoaD/ThiS family protein [Gemmatimonadaceae bacterium]
MREDRDDFKLMVTVGLPSYLQQFAAGKERVEVNSGGSLRKVLSELGKLYPGVKTRVLTEQGEIRPHINVFVGERNSRFENGLETVVPDGAEVLILAAVSGG